MSLTMCELEKRYFFNQPILCLQTTKRFRSFSTTQWLSKLRLKAYKKVSFFNEIIFIINQIKLSSDQLWLGVL